MSTPAINMSTPAIQLSFGKRKNSDDETTGPAAKRARRASSPFAPAPMPNDRSLILELPAELRNRVYDMVLEDCPPQLSRNPRKGLATTSGLLRVNKQMFSELSAHLLENPATIQTTVLDYKFGHIITFFNSLSDAELKKMTPQAGEDEETKPAKRNLEVTMHFTEHWFESVEPVSNPNLPFQDDVLCDHKELARWLDRAGDVEEKGVGVDITYKPGDQMRRAYHQLYHYQAVLEYGIEDEMDEDLMSEAEKMSLAESVRLEFGMKGWKMPKRSMTRYERILGP